MPGPTQLRCAGELSLFTPARGTLTLTAAGQTITLSCQKGRELFPLVKLLYQRSSRFSARQAARVLLATGLQVQIRAGSLTVAELGSQGSWLGALLGLPSLRLHLSRAVRTL